MHQGTWYLLSHFLTKKSEVFSMQTHFIFDVTFFGCLVGWLGGIALVIVEMWSHLQRAGQWQMTLSVSACNPIEFCTQLFSQICCHITSAKNPHSSPTCTREDAAEYHRFSSWIWIITKFTSKCEHILWEIWKYFEGNMKIFWEKYENILREIWICDKTSVGLECMQQWPAHSPPFPCLLSRSFFNLLSDQISCYCCCYCYCCCCCCLLLMNQHSMSTVTFIKFSSVLLIVCNITPLSSTLDFSLFGLN